MAAALAEDGFHTGLELIQHLHRHESLHRAGETAAVDADSTLIAQQMLGGSDGHAHFLMLLVACGDDVLQIFPAAAAGLVHEAEEGVEVAIVECSHLLCHTVIVGVDVEGTEDGAVAALPAALGQLCKEGLERHIPQHLAAADSGYGAALSRDGGVLVGQVGVVCAGVEDAEGQTSLEKSTATGSTTGFAGLAKSMVMMLPTLEAIWSIRPQGLPK